MNDPLRLHNISSGRMVVPALFTRTQVSIIFFTGEQRYRLTYLNPLRYFPVIICGIFLKGVGLQILWPQYAAMALLGIFVFAGAVARFRKRLD